MPATTARTNDIDMVRNLGADEVIDFTKKDSADVLTGSDLVLGSLGGTNRSEVADRPQTRGGLAISLVGPPTPGSQNSSASRFSGRSWQL